MENLMTAEVEALRSFLLNTTGAVSLTLTSGATVTLADVEAELLDREAEEGPEEAAAIEGLVTFSDGSRYAGKGGGR